MVPLRYICKVKIILKTSDRLKNYFSFKDVVSEPLRYQGRIQAVFDIGNRFWAHKNWRPNFDRSTKDMILILFNSRYIDLNNET